MTQVSGRGEGGGGGDIPAFPSHTTGSLSEQTGHSNARKDIVWRQEVPAEDLIGQCEVALENRRHLSVEVFSAAELLQHLHGQHEDLVEAVLLGGGGDARRG